MVATVAKSLPAEKKVILYNDRKGKVKIKYLSSDGNKKKVVMEGYSGRVNSLGDKYTILCLSGQDGIEIEIGGELKTFVFSAQSSVSGDTIEWHIK